MVQAIPQNAMPIAPFALRSLNRGILRRDSQTGKGADSRTADIVEETEETFQAKRVFGAFAMLHCMIEFWMQEICEFDARKTGLLNKLTTEQTLLLWILATG